MSGYIGVLPVPQTTQTRESFTATAGQTSFGTSGYQIDHLDVYLNGVKLAAADFTATNGSDIVLATGAALNDILEMVAFETFTIANQSFTGTTTVDTLVVTNTVDGRDVSVDGAKLDTIPIISTSSTPSFTAKGDGTTDGYIQLNCSQNSHGIKLKSPPHSANASYTLTFPNDDGNAGQFLKTNGSGVLSWATDSTTDSTKLPLAGGAMTGPITTNSTFDGVDVATRDAVLTSTTTTAGAALPKAGGVLTGAVTTNSTFDGRDVATDGTKLDTVETNADVTDTANVTAAGALMDSEVTNLAQVKAFASSDYATAAQGTTADAALPKAGGALTGEVTTTNVFKAHSSSSGDYVRMYGGSGTGKWDIYGNGANLRIGDNESAGIVTIDTALNVGGTITSSDISVNSGGAISNIAVSGSGRADLFLIDSGAGTDAKRKTIRSDGGVLTFGTETDAVDAFTSHMTISNTGNVAITNHVGINKAVSSSVGLSVGADSTATNSYGLEVTNASANTRFLVDGVGSSFFYKTDNAVGMKFDSSSGNVGIGTSSITDGKLCINGGANNSSILSGRSDGGNGNNGRFKITAFADGGGANYGGGIGFHTRSTTNVFSEAMRIDSSGNVGIKTNDPAASLHVDSDNSFAGLVLSRDGGASGRRPFGMAIGGSTDSTLYITASADTTATGAFSNYLTLMELYATGNVSVKTGNLEIGTSGKGINFSAYGTGTNISSNLLDDYEEGTFNPTFVNGTVGTNLTTGEYTKIGNTVYVNINLNVGSVTNLHNSYVGPLPFTPNTYTTMSVFPINGFTQLGAMICAQVATDGKVQLYLVNNSTGANYTLVASSHLNLNSVNIRIAGSYTTNS